MSLEGNFTQYIPSYTCMISCECNYEYLAQELEKVRRKKLNVDNKNTKLEIHMS